MIGLCVDSGSQLTPELLERFGALAVPLTVEFDGHGYLEGVDLDADGFYERFHDGVRPTMVIAEPSPGQFALAYEELAERGCGAVLSVHGGGALPGVLNAARLAAHKSSVPVRLVETGLAGFATACCVWAASDAIRRGVCLDDAASVAEALAPRIGNVFTVSTLELLARGGTGGHETPVLTARDGRLESLGTARSLDEAVETMTAAVLAEPGEKQVAIGVADRRGVELTTALARRLGQERAVCEVVTFRVGASAGAQSGPGTTAVYFFPAGDPLDG